MNYALKSIRAHYSLKTHDLQKWRTLFRVLYAHARLFELVFSMTASMECHVSRVFSAFMRKATHISAGEDSVLQTEKTEKNGAHFGHFGGKSSFPMTATWEKNGSAKRSNTVS